VLPTIYASLIVYVSIKTLQFKESGGKYMILVAFLNIIIKGTPFVYDLFYKQYNINDLITTLLTAIFSIVIIFYFGSKRIKNISKKIKLHHNNLLKLFYQYC
jgi:hypothetical protein